MIGLYPCDLTAPVDESVLSADERARAARLLDPGRRARWRTARAALRHTLATVTGSPPAALTFAVTPAGKPFLPALPTLHFNFTHSRDHALLAVADRPVGVDLEWIDPGVHYVPMLDLMATPDEIAALGSFTDPSAARLAFYRLWTRKEAYLKGRGIGFSGHPVNGFAHARAVTVWAHDPPGWTITPIAAPPGYAAALALSAVNEDEPLCSNS